MADDTKNPAPTTSAVLAESATAGKPQTAKPAVKRRTTRTAKPAASKPASKRTPVAPKKAGTRPAAAPKPAPAKKAAQAAKPASTEKGGKPAKAKKVKLVRDSFTMPETEYALIASLKKRCLNAGVSAKKSEILRAAVAGLAKLSDASVVAAIRRLEVIKTGRPAKGAK
jgi:hypothetical protein